jgi:hypothetical protein
MSVWKDIKTLNQFVYRSDHVRIYKRRKEWFNKMAEMHMAMWYVEPGQMPAVRDAQERLIYIRNNGETPFAFSLKKRFTVEDAIKFVAVTA